MVWIASEYLAKTEDWVNFSDHKVLRTVTKKKMFRKLKENQKEETKASYLGMLSHGNGWKLKEKIKNMLQ